jgi:hypothetical protein
MIRVFIFSILLISLPQLVFGAPTQSENNWVATLVTEDRKNIMYGRFGKEEPPPDPYIVSPKSEWMEKYEGAQFLGLLGSVLVTTNARPDHPPGKVDPLSTDYIIQTNTSENYTLLFHDFTELKEGRVTPAKIVRGYKYKRKTFFADPISPTKLNHSGIWSYKFTGHNFKMGSIKMRLKESNYYLKSSLKSNHRFTLTLSHEKDKQVIYDSFKDSDMLDEPRIELVWAGDLNSDGRMDLLMIASPKYNHGILRLFMSSKTTFKVSEIAQFQLY